MSWYPRWQPYVPVARRRARAAVFAKTLAKKEGRASRRSNPRAQIATSFWGLAWCDHLECFSDFENRLPRGRTYIRNGSVLDLQIGRGTVKAIVSGSEIYKVNVKIKTLPAAAWNEIKQDCSQSIDSLIDLLQGRLDDGIMKRLTHRDKGLFPAPREITMSCSCPDDARLCKHLAAVLYGVGTRLDSAPELLFTLRDVDHLELITQAVAASNLEQTLGGGKDSALGGDDLGAIFGIELASAGDATGDTHADKAGIKPAKGSARKKPAVRKRSVAVAVAAAAKAPVEPEPRRFPSGAQASPPIAAAVAEAATAREYNRSHRDQRARLGHRRASQTQIDACHPQEGRDNGLGFSRIA